MKTILNTFQAKEGHCPHSLGAQSIASYCLRRGHNVNLVSLPLNVEEATKAILEESPDICGFTVNFVTESFVRNIIRRVTNQKRPLIVLGGSSITYSSANSPIRKIGADLFVKGDGEKPFFEILENYGDIDSVLNGDRQLAGVSSRQFYDEQVSTIDLEETVSPFPLKFETDHVYWETVRGCVFNCIYCAHPGQSRIFRQIPLERINQEADYLATKPLRAVYITDPVLGGEKNRSKEILRILKRLNGKFITAEYRPEYLDEEVLDLLEEANIGWLELGLQTTNEHLSYFRKNSKNAMGGLPKLSRRKIRYSLDLIAGIPGDTRETFEESLRFAIEIAKPTSLKVFPLRVYEGTELQRLADNRGWEYDTGTRIIKNSDTFTEEEAQEWIKLGKYISLTYDILTENNWFGKETEYRKLSFLKRIYEQANLKFHSEDISKSQLRGLIKLIGARDER